MNRLYLAVLLILVSAFGHAAVDMRNGNYTESWIDVSLGGVGPELKVFRTYNSRTSFDGMFGYGWCSDFETRIEFMPDASLKLVECGAGKEVVYVPDERAGEPVRRFHAHGKEFDNIVYAAGAYVRTTPDRYKETFDSSGRRTRFEDPSGNSIRQDYQDGRLQKVSRNDGSEIVFSYADNGKVESATATGNKTVAYRHAGSELTSVTNAWGNSYAYQYDARHRLKRAEWPDAHFIALQYDAAHDWVIGFTDREGCQESYEYRDAPDDAKNHYLSNLVKTCNGETVMEG